MISVGLAVAIASTVAGAVLSLLPGVIIGLILLFYNSFGGAMIFLGNAITPFISHPIATVGGRGPLRLFQQLHADAGAVVLRSIAATLLCAMAAAVLARHAAAIGSSRRLGESEWPSWVAVGLCCFLAAVIGGRPVALAVFPAIAVAVAGVGSKLGGRWFGR